MIQCGWHSYSQCVCEATRNVCLYRYDHKYKRARCSSPPKIYLNVGNYDATKSNIYKMRNDVGKRQNYKFTKGFYELALSAANCLYKLSWIFVNGLSTEKRRGCKGGQFDWNASKSINKCMNSNYRITYRRENALPKHSRYFSENRVEWIVAVDVVACICFGCCTCVVSSLASFSVLCCVER